MVVALLVIPHFGHAQSPPATTPLASISGTVTGVFDGTRRPLPFAVIQAQATTVRRSVRADADGRYRIDRLPSGRIQLSVTQTGHEQLDLEVVVPQGASLTVDLELRASPVQLDPLDVVRDRRDIPDADGRDAPPLPASLPEVEVQVLEATPGVGLPGLLDAVRSLPGNDPAQATDVLFMRGSTTDLKLVLLNGAPVYTPFHVGGLLRSFEPGVLGRAELHVGGAPARYDGGLTHILDMETRSPRRDRMRVSGSVDFLAATAAVEGGSGPLGFMATSRTLHDLGTEPLGGESPYGYRDLLAALEWTVAPDHTIRTTAFSNREAVRLDFPSLPDDAFWSNQALSASYRGRVGTSDLRIEAASSAYSATLPLQPTALEGEEIPSALLAGADSDRLRVLAELKSGGPDAWTGVGLSHDRINAAYDARNLGGGPVSSSQSRTTSTGLFAESQRRLAPGVTLRAGLRADAFSTGGVRFAPRAALTWDVGPAALLTVAAGRYHQSTRTPDVEVERTLAEVVEEDLPANELLPVATADHIVVALDQLLADRVRLGLQGYWKGYRGLETAPRETVRSSGIDLRIRSTGDDAVVWVGYGLSWFWSTQNLSGYASDFAGRHLLSAGAAGPISPWLRGEVRLAYGAGLPYTAIPFRTSDALEAGAPGLDGESLSQDSPLVGGLDEDFLRVDVEVYGMFRPRWAGRTWSVRPYLRVLNALDRRDALFYTFQPWRSDSLTPLAERPLLPVLGIAFAF